MTTVRIDNAHQIGEAAGAIWHYLNVNGPLTFITTGTRP